jgi:hypothetical protein
MSLIDTVIGRITKVEGCKKKAKLTIEASAGNFPDDLMVWEGEYALLSMTVKPAGTKDQDVYIPEGGKTPIEEYAEKNAGTEAVEPGDGCHHCKFGFEDSGEASGWNCSGDNGPEWEEGVCNNFEEKED